MAHPACRVGVAVHHTVEPMTDKLQGTLVRAGVDEAEGEEGEYQVVRSIGSGSFGKVFLVLHREEGRHFVMKEIAAFAQMEAKQQETTEQEVLLLREMQHPNIVSYRDSYVNRGGHLLIFMEYCEHGDVHSYLQSGKRGGKGAPCESLVLEWLVQITLALAALHARRILHRDLKTQNVFLSGQGSAMQRPGAVGCFALKLGDLGIARVLDSTLELAATQIGTPLSMSPEVFNNKPYGFQSDIWGLGCVLYEMMHNGSHAFEAQSINALALKILRGRYTPVTSGSSKETKELIGWMLKTNPKKRPTLQDVLHAPAVRRQVPTALQSANQSAPTPEAKAWAEQVLSAQLTSLGFSTFGGAVGSRALAGGGPGGGSGKEGNVGSGRGGGSGKEGGSDAGRRGRREMGGGAAETGSGASSGSSWRGASHPRARRQAQLQQRLEKVERRKKREEEALRRLQETAEVLKGYLRETRGSPQGGVGSCPPSGPAGTSLGTSPSGGGGAGGGGGEYSAGGGGRGRFNGGYSHCHASGTSSGFSVGRGVGHSSGYAVPQSSSLQGGHASMRSLQLPLAPLQGASQAVVSHSSEPNMHDWGQPESLTHRDRVLQRKELRREEEHQRFEEEARKIREENLAYQRAWHRDSKDHVQGTPGSSARHGDPAPAPNGRPPAPLSPLIDYAHATADEQGAPFRIGRPVVARTPRQRLPSSDRMNSEGQCVGTRSRGHSSGMPFPPPARHKEPIPPSQISGHKWNHWNGAVDPVVTSRSLHSVCLESLANEHHIPEHSEVSECSGSHSDINGSDGCTSGERLGRASSDEQLRRQSLGVQRRIAQCRAVISKHKSTIEALQGACLCEQTASGRSGMDFFGDGLRTPASATTAGAADCGGMPPPPSGGPVVRRRKKSDLKPTPSLAAAPAPAMVQDRVARLRRRCQDGLGVDKFEAVRQCLQGLVTADVAAAVARERMLDMLGADKIGFYALVDQIVHMEQRWGVDPPGLVRRTTLGGASDTGSDAAGWRSGSEHWPPPAPGSSKRYCSPGATKRYTSPRMSHRPSY